MDLVSWVVVGWSLIRAWRSKPLCFSYWLALRRIVHQWKHVVYRTRNNKYWQVFLNLSPSLVVRSHRQLLAFMLFLSRAECVDDEISTLLRVGTAKTMHIVIESVIWLTRLGRRDVILTSKDHKDEGLHMSAWLEDEAALDLNLSFVQAASYLTHVHTKRHYRAHTHEVSTAYHGK